MVTAIFFSPFLIDNRACTVGYLGYAHCTPMGYSGHLTRKFSQKPWDLVVVFSGIS